MVPVITATVVGHHVKACLILTFILNKKARAMNFRIISGNEDVTDSPVLANTQVDSNRQVPVHFIVNDKVLRRSKVLL